MIQYKYLVVDALTILFSSSSFIFNKKLSYAGYFLIGFALMEAFGFIMSNRGKTMQKKDIYLDTCFFRGNLPGFRAKPASGRVLV